VLTGFPLRHGVRGPPQHSELLVRGRECLQRLFSSIGIGSEELNVSHRTSVHLDLELVQRLCQPIQGIRPRRRLEAIGVERAIRAALDLE
jgi:hypothetical protein